MLDYATNKTVPNTPEEAVRQEYEKMLIDSYGYAKEQLDIEVPIPRGAKGKSHAERADIVIYRDGTGRDPAADILGIVECKKLGVTDGEDQLKSYMSATSAQWGVWTNGVKTEYFSKPSGQSRITTSKLWTIPRGGGWRIKCHRR